ncbi:TonB-dependent receptor [Rhodocytophaga aerolata]|uniref:TonB-dependent receptor n=1 Tax=Rhodocytophaga aerolata TaxID=455078 RepID=A0ABT8RDR7_9BACT|nr:TonB-dependent receptor [Rhodocytophaga aerolata]MDO1449378.1 TonB-dependent receptor [Rhodocytophaga aerolata]
MEARPLLKPLRLVFLLQFLCMIHLSLAQSAVEVRLTGVITSEMDGSPLPGANVIVQSTSKGTTTDANGQFQLTVPANATLVISYIGYQSRTIAVGNQTQIKVALTPDVSSLDEVVVVGYGTVKKSDLSGSVATVAAEEIKSLPIASLEQGIQGRVAGVQVMQGNSAPGGAPQVRIRGANTVLGGSEPLYVIDGVPVYNAGLINEDGLNIGTQPSNALASINPNDIESMEILKDASATAIYGARGANGVVIITTKRGKAGERGQLSFESYYGMQQVSNKLDLMNAQDFIRIMNERARNLGQAEPYANPAQYTTSTDWQDLLFRTAPIQNYSLSYSGGSKQNQYNVSGNWFDQQGIVINSGFKRGSVRINLDNKINDQLKFVTSLTASRSINNRASNNWLSNAFSAFPTVNPYNSNGGYNDFSDSEAAADPTNPLEVVEKSLNKLTVDRILGSVMGEYTLLEGLTFSIRMGLDNQNQLNDIFVRRGNFTYPFPGATVKQDYNTNVLNENILSFNRELNGKHKINAITGFTWQQNTSRYFQQGGTGFQFEAFETNNLGAASITEPNVSSKGQSTILSWLGRVNYVFDDKYIVTFTSRADGSSRFGENNKWAFFPSGALAWRVSRENFMRNIPFISDLKVRTSYGVTGNQEIGLYNSISRMSSVVNVMGASQNAAIGYVPTSLANKDLKWEINKQFDAGIDLSVWQGRVSLTADYYIKRTDDLLANLPIPGSSGFSTILINSGSIENKGFELGATAHLIDKAFTWSINANISRNNTKVLDLAVETAEFFAASIPSPIDRPVNIIREGEVLSAFYGFVEDGLNETGDIRYKDLNGDGVINDNDQTILGSPYPDIIYGFTSNMAFKNFYLSIFFQGVEGVSVFNSNEFLTGNSLARIGNQLTAVNDRWTTDNFNPNAKYPRASNIANRVSDRYIQDASYLRLKNIVLGYNLPAGKLGISWLQAARIYVSGQNLLTFTKYNGYDPEVSQTGTNSLVKGLDRGSYPSAKVYNIGLNVTF